MSSRKFVYVFVIIIAIFVVSHLIIWETSMKKVLAPPDGYVVGDISRIGYDPSIVRTKKSEIITLKRRHQLYNTKLSKKIDMVTFGDSFTRGNGGGVNPFFQDYIEKYSGINVAHFHNYLGHYNCVNTLLIMLNSGIFDEIKPKYVILESAQREVPRRLGINLDLEKKFPKNNVKKYYSTYPEKPFNTLKGRKVKFINSGNYKYLLFKFLYLFDEKAFISKIYRFGIKDDYPDRPYMSIYKDDIRFIRYVTPSSIAKVNQNLNAIGKKLQEKGIKLYFMPAPDKYTLYYKCLADNKHPRSKFFDLLRKQDKKYYTLIDTLAILDKEIDKKTKGIYFPDDTHWTNKASNAIFKEVKFE